MADGPTTSERMVIARLARKLPSYAAAKVASRAVRESAPGPAREQARLEYEKAKVRHWKASEGFMASKSRELGIGDSEAHRGYLIKKGFGEQYHISRDEAHIYTARSLEHAKSEIDNLVGEPTSGPFRGAHGVTGMPDTATLRAQQQKELAGRQALVEAHRASEHLFKPAEESAHGNSSAMKWEQHGASYVARHGDATYRVSVAAKGGFDAFVDKPDGTVVRLRGGPFQSPQGAMAKAKDHRERSREIEVGPHTARAEREGAKLRDPQKEQLARLQQARNVQTGKRGGRFYALPGGGKKYVRD